MRLLFSLIAGNETRRKGRSEGKGGGGGVLLTDQSGEDLTSCGLGR